MNFDRMTAHPEVGEVPMEPEKRSVDGELYHLTEDPYELTNLYDDPKYAPSRAEMEGVLFDWLAGSQDPNLEPVRDPEDSGK
jgi:hypothetical protein